MDYRADIDGLRAVAVLPVVIFHAGLGLDGGFVGVDIFFVISGYLITSLLLHELAQRRFSILDFYERRARRIFPALFAMIFVTTIVSLVLMSPQDLENFARSAIAATAFFANIWFYTQEGYFNEASELQPLLHTWSLGIEEQYYLLFPPMLWLIVQMKRWGGALAILLVCLGLSLAFCVWATGQEPNAAFYLPQYRVWELLIGSTLAIAVSQNRLAWIAGFPGFAGLAAAIGLGSIAWSVAIYGPETQFPGMAALLPCLGAALLIAVGGHVQTPVSRLLSSAPLVFIGKLSYSLYLWHWPIIAFVFYTGDGNLEAPQGLACLIVAFLLAYGSWRFIEQPFRDRRRMVRKTIFGSSLAAIAIVFTTSAFIMQSEGLASRMPPEIQALMDPEIGLHDRRDCHFVSPERALADQVCARGAPSVEPSFVLVGDSHADAFSPAIFSAAERLGLAGYQYTNAGFRPMVGVSKQGDPDWQRQTENLIAFLKERPAVKTIIATAYWEHQMTGYTYRHEGDVWKDAGYDGTGSAYNKTATVNGIRRLAEQLPDRRIILLDDVPSGEQLHLRSNIRLLRFGHGDLSGMPPAEAKRQRATYEPYFKDLAARHDRIHYHEIFNTLCGETVCPLFAGQTLLFRDGDHLSFKGALRMTERAQALFSTFGFGSTGSP